MSLQRRILQEAKGVGNATYMLTCKLKQTLNGVKSYIYLIVVTRLRYITYRFQKLVLKLWLLTELFYLLIKNYVMCLRGAV